MRPNTSERVRTGPNRSEHIQKLEKTCENLAKTSNKIPDGENYMETPLSKSKVANEEWDFLREFG